MFMLSVMQIEYSEKRAFQEFEVVVERNPVTFEIRGSGYPLDSLDELTPLTIDRRSPNGIGVSLPRPSSHSVIPSHEAMLSESARPSIPSHIDNNVLHL